MAMVKIFGLMFLCMNVCAYAAMPENSSCGVEVAMRLHQELTEEATRLEVEQREEAEKQEGAASWYEQIMVAQQEGNAGLGRLWSNECYRRLQEIIARKDTDIKQLQQQLAQATREKEGVLCELKNAKTYENALAFVRDEGRKRVRSRRF